MGIGLNGTSLQSLDRTILKQQEFGIFALGAGSPGIGFCGTVVRRERIVHTTAALKDISV